MKAVGFIGIGEMGKPMARRILEAGYPLTVYNRTASKALELEKAGAKIANSPRDVAERSEVILSILSGDHAVEEVMLGSPNGVIHGMRKGSIIVEMSTTSVDIITEMAKRAGEKGAQVLDAPVSGVPSEAEKGQVTMMVGGSKDAFESCFELLKVMCESVQHVGDLGTGRLMKYANNMLVALNLTSALEVTAWVMKTNLDPKVYAEVMKKCRGYSPIFEMFIPRLVNNRLANQHLWFNKDLELALQIAGKTTTPMPFTTLAKQVMLSAKSRESKNENELTIDVESIIKVFEDLVGIHLQNFEQKKGS
jgi:3-hydroxyisobutyrate dehydrogenase-like beta-hydroxyacid dehydrogenase